MNLLAHLGWTARPKIEPRDLWIGVFWDRRRDGLHIYLCPLPTVLLHLHRTGGWEYAIDFPGDPLPRTGDLDRAAVEESLISWREHGQPGASLIRRRRQPREPDEMPTWWYVNKQEA